VPLTYVYSDQHSHEPLARIDGVNTPDIYWFHNQPNGTPERLTDAEGRVCQEAQNSAWGKLLHERDTQRTYSCRMPRTCGCRASTWIGTNLSGTNLNACSATPEGRATGKWRVNRTSL